MPHQDLSSFTHWLRTQTDRFDAVGALARSAIADRGWPLAAKTAKSYDRYLRDHAIGGPMQVALYDAWAEYDAERDRNR